MIVALFAVNVAFAVAAAIIYVVSAKKKKIPCNSCQHCIKSGGGGAWEYYCAGGDHSSAHPDYFDRPPKYCKYYEPREANK